MIFLLERGEALVRTSEGREVINYERLSLQLKYYYRRLRIEEIGRGRYQVEGKKGFQILVEEVL